MSVGKASIKRAASAGTKKTAASSGKSSAKAKTAKTSTAKADAAKVTTTKADTAKAASAKAAQTQSAVISPENTEEILVKFMTRETPEEKQKNAVLSGRAVRLNEEMPDYLL